METIDTQTTTQEQESATWGITGTLLWGVLVMVIYVLVQTAVTLVYASVVQGEISEELLAQIKNDGTVLSLSTFATLVLCGPIVIGIIKLKRNSTIASYLAINKIDLKQIRFWSLSVLALIVITDSLTYFQGKPVVVEFMTDIFNSTAYPWFLFLALVVAAPIFEELFFRGFLLAGFSSTFLGPIGAVIVTSAVWSAIHFQYDLWGIFTIFAAGLLLGLARVKTNSILTAVMMHSIMNLVATIETVIYMAVKA